MHRYSHIIWDWNGTLLNDVHWGIDAMNKMLKRRNKKPLEDLAAYHKVFCFPIIEYYKAVGFNFEEEAFESLAEEYISHYHGNGCEKLKLHDGAEDLLKTLYDNGMVQLILSASSQDNLMEQISLFNIEKYFDEILGISDIFAKSKVQIGLDYISRKKVPKALFIGDTTHDYEVAEALGADCILVANGHQSMQALLSCGVPVVKSIKEVLPCIM